MSGVSGRFMPTTFLEVHQHSSAVEPKSIVRINAVSGAAQWLE